MMEVQTKEYYKVSEVATMFNITKFGVFMWIKRGKIEAIKAEDGSWNIPANEIIRMVHSK